jgi:hypothetical protein
MGNSYASVSAVEHYSSVQYGRVEACTRMCKAVGICVRSQTLVLNIQSYSGGHAQAAQMGKLSEAAAVRYNRCSNIQTDRRQALLYPSW